MVSHIKINLLSMVVSLAPLMFLRTQHLASNKVPDFLHLFCMVCSS